MNLPLTSAQQVIREKEARLVMELSKEKNAQAEPAANWFKKRWDCEYSEVLKPVEIQR